MSGSRCKFQAMVELDATAGGPAALPAGQARRIIVKGSHHQTHRSQFFSALISNNGDSLPGAGCGPSIMTVVLTGNHLPDYFAVGDQFSLWLGGDIGHGVLTRRLFV